VLIIGFLLKSCFQEKYMKFVMPILFVYAMWIPTTTFAAGDAPPECMRFMGEWSGKWNEGRATAIIVKKIKKRDATCIAEVRYAWGEKGDSTLVREAGYLDVPDGTIENNVLHVPLTKYDAKATFSPDTENVLSGTWKKEGYGKTLVGTFKKK
jgi:hypothetical protein